MAFVNESVARERPSHLRESAYGFNKAPRLLFQWSRLFQAVISQAGTFLFTGKFHDGDCGIYKCEGGCRVAGRELVLTSNVCHWNYGRSEKDEADARRMSDLITKVVLEWNPNDPIDSMIASAAEFIGCPPNSLKDALGGASCGGPFGGDALSSFFDWNPFSEPPYDPDYRRWCMVQYGNMTAAEVDQKFADEALGKFLLAKLVDAARQRNPRECLTPLCCSPRRHGKSLSFWVNTGRTTQIDGWQTQSDLEKWLSSGEPLKDKAKW